METPGIDIVWQFTFAACRCSTFLGGTAERSVEPPAGEAVKADCQLGRQGPPMGRIRASGESRVSAARAGTRLPDAKLPASAAYRIEWSEVVTASTTKASAR